MSMPGSGVVSTGLRSAPAAGAARSSALIAPVSPALAGFFSHAAAHEERRRQDQRQDCGFDTRQVVVHAGARFNRSRAVLDGLRHERYQRTE